jgi:hypothetical protein
MRSELEREWEEITITPVSVYFILYSTNNCFQIDRLRIWKGTKMYFATVKVGITEG